MADPVVPLPPEDSLTLDDLIEAYNAEPSRWIARLFIYAAATNRDGSVKERTAGDSLGPYDLPDAPVSDGAIWRVVAARMGGPGRAVLRLKLPGQASIGQLTASLNLTPALWAVWGPKPGEPPPPRAAPQPTPAAVAAPVYAAPVQSPPTDLVGIVLSAMTAQQTMMMNMMQTMTTPKVDPAVEVLRAEIARLSEQLKAPAAAAKTEREEWLQMGKDLAGKDSFAAAALGAMQGPIDRIASAIERTADTRSQIELRDAETRQLIAATKAQAAGVPMDDVEVKPGA